MKSTGENPFYTPEPFDLCTLYSLKCPSNTRNYTTLGEVRFLLPLLVAVIGVTIHLGKRTLENLLNLNCFPDSTLHFYTDVISFRLLCSTRNDWRNSLLFQPTIISCWSWWESEWLRDRLPLLCTRVSASRIWFIFDYCRTGATMIITMVRRTDICHGAYQHRIICFPSGRVCLQSSWLPARRGKCLPQPRNSSGNWLKSDSFRRWGWREREKRETRRNWKGFCGPSEWDPIAFSFDWGDLESGGPWKSLMWCGGAGGRHSLHISEKLTDWGAAK